MRQHHETRPAAVASPVSSLPDLSSLTEEQRTAVAYMAQREAAALIRRALDGANDRLAAAIASGVMSVPVFHLEDIARIEANWSPGTWGDLSGEDRMREIVREEIDHAFPAASEDELTPL